MQYYDDLYGVVRLESLEFTNTFLNCYGFLFDGKYFSTSSALKNNPEGEGFSWSPYIRVSPSYSAFYCDVSLVPPEKASDFSAKTSSLSGVKMYSAAAAAGILGAYSFAPGAYVSAMLSLGWIINKQELSFIAYERESSRTNNFIFDYRLQAGYIGDELYMGGSLIYQFQSGTLEKTIIDIGYNGINVFAGVKF